MERTALTVKQTGEPMEGHGPPRRKLVFVITGLEYGGAEIQVAALACALMQRGWQVEVVTIKGGGALSKQLAKNQIPVHSLDVTRLREFGLAMWRLCRLLRKIRPDVVHANMPHANIITRLSRIFVQVPVLVCTAHNVREGGRLRELAYRATDRLSTITTQVSMAGLDRYRQIRAVSTSRSTYMPNGVDTEHLVAVSEEGDQLRAELGLKQTFVWLTIGRLTPAKDYPNLIRAIHVLRGLGHDAKVLIRGSGPLLQDLHALIQHLDLGDRVIFVEPTESVRQLLNAADAFVLASAWEGMPLVLQEAHSVGLPIVATDVGGNKQVVLDGKTGYLAPPQNPEALAIAMKRVMTHPPAERRAMGNRGREHIVRTFSLKAVAESWDALYKDLLRADYR